MRFEVLLDHLVERRRAALGGKAGRLAERVDARQLDLAVPPERLGAGLRQPDELDAAQPEVPAAAGDRIA